MEFFKYKQPLDFMKKSKIAMTISIILMLASYAILASKGLNYGIDFAGGTIVQVKYDKQAPIEKIRSRLSENKLFDNATITKFGSPNEIIIRMKKSTASVTKNIGNVTRKALKGTGNFKIRRVDIVGPKVGSELKKKGLMALFLSVAAILIYVAFRFEWRFAVASIVALIHDVSIAMGAVSLFQIDVNLDVLAAILTLLGYSLNDTIIVFDRIREGITRSKNINLTEIINESITRTLARTTLTSLTTFFVVFTLFMFGGAIIHAFAFTLLVGIVVGTYSSIFVASPILILFGFDVKNYHAQLAEKAKREAEKNRMREQYESGVM
ncbi:protein translocase subunit SecF [Sulfurimonas sp.]